jgi:hypothetical protein
MTPSEKLPEFAAIVQRNVKSSATDCSLRSYVEVQCDLDFLAEEYDRLVEIYPDQWIAIYDRKVVAADDDHSALLEHLGSDGVDARSAVVFFIASTPQIFV